MSSEKYAGEVRVPIVMPEIGIEQCSDFIKAEKAKLELALKEGKELQASGPLIQRVPTVLIGIKEDFKKYFEPRLVALGPLHHGNTKLERAEHSKRKLAALFAMESGKSVESLFGQIKKEIKDLRKRYAPAATEKYDDDELAWMLFVDGCAVLFAIHYGMKGDFNKLNTKAELLVFAQLDLFLLENQIPYRVLKILISNTGKPKEWEKSIAEFVNDNLITNTRDGQQMIKSQQHKVDEDEVEEMGEYSHLLERLRAKLLKGEKEKSGQSMIGGLLLKCGDNRKLRKTFRSVKELKESGIRVRPSNNNNSLRNISFYCNFLGRLRMPRILVDDSTASKLLNLVALEMCRDFDNDFGVTSYLCFLDSLIDTAEDVKELRVTGMLHNYLGSDEEVADLFNKMSRDLVPDQEAYEDVTESIHKYCNNNAWTTTLVQAYYTYFSSPWTFIAFLGAMLGLLFSAIQAYYAFPHNNPREDNQTP